MPKLAHVAAAISTLYRLFAFIFLRVLPSPLGTTILPFFFILHLASSPFLGSKKDLGKSEKEAAFVKPKTTGDALYAVLFSLPTSSGRVRAIIVLINSLLFLSIIEFTLTPFLDTASDVIFTRVGAVYPDSVKIAVRYPGDNVTENVVQILWRQSTADINETSYPWRDGPLLKLSNKEDWVGTANLAGLWPSTSYEYTLAAANRTFLPYPSSPIPFHTFPDPRLPTGTHFRFLASSCISINFPYAPLQGRRIKGFDLLAKYLFPPALPDSTQLSTTPAPAEFLLFLGDFIYADVPLYVGDSEESYRRLYRRNYQSPSFRQIYERLPVFHIYDDHEIINNFEGQSNDTAPFPVASDAFKTYNANANYDPVKKDQHYYNFQYGDAAFFVLDTRRHRSRDAEKPTEHTMLGDVQLGALFDWLGRVNSTTTFKFIVTSVPFTSLWTYDHTDSWAGYPFEKSALLDALHSVPNIVIISGDRHEFADIEFNGQGYQIREFSTSPLSMFYVPLIRTLKSQSDEAVVIKNTSTQEEDSFPLERAKKYIPTGNYKWSTFEVDTRDREHPKVTVEVTVGGKPAYEVEIQGHPVNLQSSTALGTLVSTGFKEIFDRIGMQPSRWF